MKILTERSAFYLIFFIALLVTAFGAYSESESVESIVKIVLFALKVLIAGTLGVYIYRVKRNFLWLPLVLLVLFPFGFFTALILFFWFRKLEKSTQSEKTAPFTQNTPARNRIPLKRALSLSAIMGLSPALLSLSTSPGESSSFVFALIAYVLATPLICFVSLYPAFSDGRQRWIWLFSSLIIPALIVGWFYLVWFVASLGSFTALLGIGMLLLLAPISVLVIYIVLAGYALRAVLYSRQNKTRGIIFSVIVFLVPFLLWYGGKPFLEFLSDGLERVTR